MFNRLDNFTVQNNFYTAPGVINDCALFRLGTEFKVSCIPLLGSWGICGVCLLWYSGNLFAVLILSLFLSWIVRRCFSSPHLKFGNIPLGLFLLITSEVCLFGGCIIAFMVYDRYVGVSNINSADTVPMMSCGVLLSSSLYASVLHAHSNRSSARLFMAIVLFLGVSFIAIQIYEWWSAVGGIMNNQYTSISTGIVLFHLAHVVAGLIILCLWGRYLRESSSYADQAIWYWHFVDVVWVFVYVLVYRKLFVSF